MEKLYKGLIAKYDNRYFRAVKRGNNAVDLISYHHEFKNRKMTTIFPKEEIQELFLIGYYADFYGYKCSIEGVGGKRILIGTVFDPEDKIQLNLGFKEIGRNYCAKWVEVEDCAKVYMKRTPIPTFALESEPIVIFNRMEDLINQMNEYRK